LNTQDNQQHMKQPELSVRTIDPDEHLDALIKIERSCFPKRLQESRQGFMETRSDPWAFGLLLFTNNEASGYIHGTHIQDSDAACFIEKYPILDKHHLDIFYVDSIAIQKVHRSPMAFDYLIQHTARHLANQGYRFVTAFIRKRNGFSRVFQRRFGAEVLHTSKNWHGSQEEFDFIFVPIKNIVPLPTLKDRMLNRLRSLARRKRA